MHVVSGFRISTPYVCAMVGNKSLSDTILSPDSSLGRLSLSISSMSPSMSLPSLELSSAESELEPVDRTEDVESLPLTLGFDSVVFLEKGWMDG